MRHPDLNTAILDLDQGALVSHIGNKVDVGDADLHVLLYDVVPHVDLVDREHPAHVLFGVQKPTLFGLVPVVVYRHVYAVQLGHQLALDGMVVVITL